MCVNLEIINTINYVKDCINIMLMTFIPKQKKIYRITVN